MSCDGGIRKERKERREEERKGKEGRWKGGGERERNAVCWKLP